MSPVCQSAMPFRLPPIQFRVSKFVRWYSLLMNVVPLMVNTFLDFVLCLHNRHELQSLHYLFRILDVQHNGYLTVQTLHYFFSGILEQIRACNAVAVNFEDLKYEIFDMANQRIRIKLRCKIY